MGCVSLPSVESDYTSHRSRGAEESPPSMSRVLEDISDNALYILNMSAILPARDRRKFLCSYSNFRRYPTSPQTTSRAPFFASESTTSVHRTIHGHSSFPKFKHSRKRPRSHQEDTSSSPNLSVYSIGNAKAYSANRGNTSFDKSLTAIRNIQRVRTPADVESNLPLVIASIANPSLLAEEREWMAQECHHVIVEDFFLAFDIRNVKTRSELVGSEYEFQQSQAYARIILFSGLYKARIVKIEDVSHALYFLSENRRLEGYSRALRTLLLEIWGGGHDVSTSNRPQTKPHIEEHESLATVLKNMIRSFSRAKGV